MQEGADNSWKHKGNKSPVQKKQKKMFIYNKDKTRESKLIEHIRMLNRGHPWSVLIGSIVR